MKRKSILTVIAAIFCCTLISANEVNFKNPENSISEQLQEILSENSIAIENSDLTARILFQFDGEGKIEILQVASESSEVKWFVHKKLSGKKIAIEDMTAGEVFVVDVRVTS